MPLYSLAHLLSRVAQWPLWAYTMVLWCTLTLCAILLSTLGGQGVPTEVFEHFTPKTVIIAVVLSPLFETIVFQAVPIELLRRMGLSPWIRIAISAIAFGLMHYYSLSYIIIATILGSILAAGFVLRRRYCGVGSATLAVTFAHALNNALSLLQTYLSGS